MNELIRKEKALKAIETAARLCVADANHDYLMGFQDAAEAVDQIQPERSQGHWIDMHDEEELYGGKYKCSVCGNWMIGMPNFCPDCVA